MHSSCKFILIFAMLVLPVLSHGQAATDIDVLSQIVSLSKPVHFSDTEGKDLVVPAPTGSHPEQKHLIFSASKMARATTSRQEEASMPRTWPNRSLFQRPARTNNQTFTLFLTCTSMDSSCLPRYRTAALTPRQKIRLIQAARQALQNRMPFITEVYRRATTI